MEMQNPNAKWRMQIETEVLPSRAKNAFAELDICSGIVRALGNLCVKNLWIMLFIGQKNCVSAKTGEMNMSMRYSK